MSIFRRPAKSVPATESGLDEDFRRARESLAHREAMIRAERAGRLAVDAAVDSPDRPETDVLRFGVQLSRIEQGVSAMPSVGGVLRPDGTRRGESRRFAESLRDAERLELDVERSVEQTQ